MFFGITKTDKNNRKQCEYMQQKVLASESVDAIDRVVSAVSDSFDPQRAVAELAQVLNPERAECIIFFCSPQYDLDALAVALNDQFAGIQVIGCTTAGEISSEGITANSISAVCLPKSQFASEVIQLDDIAFADEAIVEGLISQGVTALRPRALKPLEGHTFAFSLLDGLSIREEIMLPVMCDSLGSIPLFGGSAADAMDFRDTFVFAGGGFHKNAAVLAIVNTTCPFHIISSNHFSAGADKLIVTKADPEKRVVLELNAEPAAPEYCRIMNVSLDDLVSETFAQHPLGVKLGEHLYTRSIRQVNEDLSLTFFCAIDNGIILSKLEDTGMLDHFRGLMNSAISRIGPLQITIACDCIHRFHEARAKGTLDDLNKLYRQYNVVGFNTYGEQSGGLHVNHSFTGIAIGYPDE